MDEHESERTWHLEYKMAPDYTARSEKSRESFLIWPIFDRNCNLQIGKSFTFINFMFFFFFRDPRISESIRIDPTQTGGPS